MKKKNIAKETTRRRQSELLCKLATGSVAGLFLFFAVHKLPPTYPQYNVDNYNKVKMEMQQKEAAKEKERQEEEHFHKMLEKAERKYQEEQRQKAILSMRELPSNVR